MATRQLPANTDISFLSDIHYKKKKKIFALCACKFSGNESHDVPFTEGALVCVTAIGPSGVQGQQRTEIDSLDRGWPNFPTLWPTDLNHHITQSRNDISPTCLQIWRKSFREVPWSNSFSGSPVAFPQDEFWLNELWVSWQPVRCCVSSMW